MIKLKQVIFTSLLFISLFCTAQSNTKEKDTISGLYLTKSHEGYLVDNYETIILQDKPYIYLSEIQEVSLGFGQQGKPIVQMVLNDIGKEKLAMATTKMVGEPLVIFLGKKIVFAPIITSPITGGELEISGNFTLPEIDGMVNWLKTRIGN